MSRFINYVADYNLMSPEDMDELLFSPFDQALGEESRERLQKQYENYEYYEGKQHYNEAGELVTSEEIPRPPGLDYDPTRYSTNYFKAIIDRKGRWQMGGQHGIFAPREQIDDSIDMLEEGYEPSSAQIKEDERADNYEEIMRNLWKENRMRTKLIQAARDRMIADRVVCKIVYNQNTGKMRWIWRPDMEYFPIYSDDDFEDLIACHFIRQKLIEDKDGEEIEAFQKQTFRMEENGECYIEEGVYDADSLDLIEVIIPHTTMGIEFIPVVEFAMDDLLGGELGDGEVSHLRQQNDILNAMNEDAIDSLKFEMFSMTALLNTPEGTSEKMRVAPGAIIEARGTTDGTAPDIKKIEGGFRWKEAFKDQYDRVKGAMHEVSGLPQIVAQDLNFGGMNGEALRILFHDIISDTEEQWLTWDYGLSELHEKTMKYLQARTSDPNFTYDKQKVNSITEYGNEMRFVLPLPDNRKELVELLSAEMANGVESKKGAMERLGVTDEKAKRQEIENEQMREKEQNDPYGGVEETKLTDDKELDAGKVMGGSRGDEELVACPTCGGSGQVASKSTGEMVTCPECKGKGVVQSRKR